MSIGQCLQCIRQAGYSWRRAAFLGCLSTKRKRELDGSSEEPAEGTAEDRGGDSGGQRRTGLEGAAPEGAVLALNSRGQPSARLPPEPRESAWE